MSKNHRSPLIFLALICAGLVIACGAPPAPEGTAGEPLKVVATTGMIADTAQRVAGENAQVIGLMGPGVDPHLYKASESDVRNLSEAGLILYNGLHLEGKMGDILVKLARSRPVVAVSEAIPEDSLREPPEFLGQYDPHVWFDVKLWSRTPAVIAEALAEADPENADDYRANAVALTAELEELDAWVSTRIAEVPDEGRIMITAHDAFGYFGDRYGVQVHGLQGISTLSEAGLKDVERIVDLVVDSKVQAIFVESSVPRRSIEAVQAACSARGHEVEIGGQLYSDAMGPAGTPEGTYVGMVRANVNTLVDALTAKAGE